MIQTSNSIHRSETTPNIKMQSSEKQGARTKTPNKDSPRHLTISNDDNNHNTVTVNQDDYEIPTRGHPSTRTTTPKTPSAPKTVGQRPHKTRRSYSGTITGVTFFPEQNLSSTSQTPQLMEDTEAKRKKNIPWTPKQFYDAKGIPTIK